MRAVTALGLLVLALCPNVRSQQCKPVEAVVTELYFQVLNRPQAPTPEEAFGWIAKLKTGCTTVRDVVRDMALSPEFKGQCDLTPPDLRAVWIYERLLDRDVTDPSNIADRNGKLKSCDNLPLVVHEFVDGAEYTGTFGDNEVPERMDRAEDRIALCGITRPANCNSPSSVSPANPSPHPARTPPGTNPVVLEAAGQTHGCTRGYALVLYNNLDRPITAQIRVREGIVDQGMRTETLGAHSEKLIGCSIDYGVMWSYYLEHWN